MLGQSHIHCRVLRMQGKAKVGWASRLAFVLLCHPTKPSNHQQSFALGLAIATLLFQAPLFSVSLLRTNRHLSSFSPQVDNSCSSSVKNPITQHVCVSFPIDRACNQAFRHHSPPFATMHMPISQRIQTAPTSKHLFFCFLLFLLLFFLSVCLFVCCVLHGMCEPGVVDCVHVLVSSHTPRGPLCVHGWVCA